MQKSPAQSPIKPFCRWHIATVENPAGTDCSAHMCEGRVFECPYVSIADSQAQEYPCADAEAL